MNIIKEYGKGKATHYTLTTEEPGACTPNRLARFETLEEAALVLRYLQGANLAETDLEEARAIMKSLENK